MANSIRGRIEQAIEATWEIVPGYFEKTLAQRAGLSESACGSIYPSFDVERLEEAIRVADWEEYSHPAIMEGCVAYKAALSGLLGIVALASMSKDAVVTLDDRKDTGKVSAVVEGVRGEEVPFTVLILGPEQGREVIFTFHPGDPVSPSKVQAVPGLHGKTVTVSEALNMGLEMAKIA